ncbi:MAG: response regulator transcription factor [Anaerolineales bacterium]|jgi:DNA-binding NarL/FixJ family response regulator
MMMNKTQIRIVLVDDHQVLRDGLRVLLEDEGDIAIVGEASTGKEAITISKKLKPEIIVVDIGLLDISGLDLIPILKKELPNVRIVILSMHTSREYVMKAIEAGCYGYVPKSSAHTSLLEAIRVVMTGERYLHPKAASALVESLQQKRTKADILEILSDRELSVVRLTAMGHTSREIGLDLSISPKTVDTYRQRAMEKLEIENRPDLIRFALQSGLLDDFMRKNKTSGEP